MNSSITTYKVSDFVGWMRDGSLKLNPDFQRNSVWKPGAKSLLIDTMIRGFPMPMILIRDMRSDVKRFSPVREVVDGQQRLRTIIGYINIDLLSPLGDVDLATDKFVINPLHNPEFGGKSFGELPESVQGDILDYSFSVSIFPPHTDDKEVRRIFARMNSTGAKLNGAEIRNAEFYGVFKTLADKLAEEQEDRWKLWRVVTKQDVARMLDIEFVADVIIAMANGVSERADKTISAFYEKWEDKFPFKTEASKRFRAVNSTIESHIGSDVVSEFFTGRTMFYALFIAVYDIQYGLATSLATKAKPKPMQKTVSKAIRAAGKRIADGQAPPSVMDATTRRTTHVGERNTLIEYLIRNT